MKRSRRGFAANVDEENPYWMSFSDIMSALLVIFILASVILMLQLTIKEQELEQTTTELEDEIEQLRRAEEVRRNILTEAAEELRRRGIQVELSENDTVLRISNELLGFDSGSDEIKPEFQTTAFEIGSVLQSLIAQGDRAEYLDTIFVEGHTDSRAFYDPRCGVEKGNWCLSAFRAISLWQFWEETLPEAQRLSLLLNKAGDPLFSVSGYAATRRAVSQEDEESDFEQNRRIDIRFTVRRPTSEEFEAVRNRVER